MDNNNSELSSLGITLNKWNDVYYCISFRDRETSWTMKEKGDPKFYTEKIQHYRILCWGSLELHWILRYEEHRQNETPQLWQRSTSKLWGSGLGTTEAPAHRERGVLADHPGYAVMCKDFPRRSMTLKQEKSIEKHSKTIHNKIYESLR